MRSLVIASSGKERRRTSVSGEEMVVEEMEKGWGSLARGGRKASLPVLTSYKRLPMMDTMDRMDTVDSSRQEEGASSRESSGSRSKRRETSGLRERKSTPSRFFLFFSHPISLKRKRKRKSTPSRFLSCLSSP